MGKVGTGGLGNGVGRGMGRGWRQGNGPWQLVLHLGQHLHISPAHLEISEAAFVICFCGLLSPLCTHVVTNIVWTSRYLLLACSL